MSGQINNNNKRPLESSSIIPATTSSASKRTKESITNNEKASTVKDQNENNETNHPDRVIPILSDDTLKVQTLTVSDQHATLLLTHDNDDDDVNDDMNKASSENIDDVTPKESAKSVVQSLLKLTLVPFHKSLLGSNPISQEKSDKPKVLDRHDPAASSRIASFLKDYSYKLKSESGAEYSYYHAAPASTTTNLACKTTTDSVFGAFDVELISPATKRQISRAMPSLGSTLIHETPEMYQQVVHPYIKSIIEDGSVGWIHNVIEGKKEKERLIVNSSQFIVNIDTKWRSHPPPLSTPREEWYDHESVQDLYCLGIVKRKGIATLRDLMGKEHIPMLQNLQQEGLAAIETIYGVKADQIRCFVHYQPQFYHFHVHFTRLENEIGATVERGHLVSDIIQNLEMDPLYYQKRTITYKLKKCTPLHNLLLNYP